MCVHNFKNWYADHNSYTCTWSSKAEADHICLMYGSTIPLRVENGLHRYLGNDVDLNLNPAPKPNLPHVPNTIKRTCLGCGRVGSLRITRCINVHYLTFRQRDCVTVCMGMKVSNARQHLTKIYRCTWVYVLFSNYMYTENVPIIVELCWMFLVYLLCYASIIHPSLRAAGDTRPWIYAATTCQNLEKLFTSKRSRSSSVSW